MNETITRVKSMIKKAGPGIPSAADKALELDKELNDSFAATLEQNWAGKGFSTAENMTEDEALEAKAAAEFAEDMANQPDFPMPNSPSGNKVFGAKPIPNVPSMASPISPEDMEKEYISDAEKTITKVSGKKESWLQAIGEMTDNIKDLEAEIEIFDRIISRATASLQSTPDKRLLDNPKPKAKAVKEKA